MFAMSGELDTAEIITTLLGWAIAPAAIVSAEQNPQTITCTLSMVTSFCAALDALFPSHFPSSITSSIFTHDCDALNLSVI
jgi:hypothetical protein